MKVVRLKGFRGIEGCLLVSMKDGGEEQEECTCNVEICNEGG